MIDSLLQDIKGQMQYGNMITRLILINVFVFIVFTLIGVFIPGGLSSELYLHIRDLFTLPGDIGQLIYRPWTIITHMFLHAGFGHIFWNMLILFWFGRIVGDLLGDDKVLPLYFAGGLAGAIFYLIFATFLSAYGGVAMGASAAIMALVVASGFLAPYYRINLLLIGEVKLMYVVAALFFIDLAMISQGSNSGGHFAHIGGAILGGLYISLLHSAGIDILSEFSKYFSGKPVAQPPKSGRIVEMKPRKKHDQSKATSESEVDVILEQIKRSGVKSLSKEEKDVLDRASKES